MGKGWESVGVKVRVVDDPSIRQFRICSIVRVTGLLPFAQKLMYARGEA